MGKLMEDVSVSELVQMREQGMTFKEMAKALDVSEELVRQNCPHEVQHRNQCGDEIRRLYAEGMTQFEIAQRLGVSQSTVSYQIRKGQGKLKKVDFSARRQKVEAQYNTEPKQEVKQEPKDEAGQMLSGFILSQTVEIGMATRKYVIHRDKDGCTVTMQAEFGEVQLTVDDLKDIAAECQVVSSWVKNHPKLGLEVV